jgi:hypothetical protein
LSWDIVDAMSTVKELMLSPDGTVAEAALLDDGAAADEAGVDAAADELDDELDDDEQPAAVRATATAATPAKPSGRRRLDVPRPCEWEDRPPSVLIPSPIPNFPFVLTRPDEQVRDTV